MRKRVNAPSIIVIVITLAVSEKFNNAIFFCRVVKLSMNVIAALHIFYSRSWISSIREKQVNENNSVNFIRRTIAIRTVRYVETVTYNAEYLSEAKVCCVSLASLSCSPAN